jgi:tetratricopeptide (TPR) repeat protein
MGQRLVQKLLPNLNKLKWPESAEATQLGRQAYEVGLDKVDDVRNDPRTLAAALRTFLSGQSLPYAYAGTAYTLVTASRENDGSYDQPGLDSALEWLEKAQELAPEIGDINMVEAYIYVYSGRYADARLVLDYLEASEPPTFHLMGADVAYWQEQGELEEAIRWYDRAISAADSVPRKLRMRSKLGDCYLQFRQYDKALNIYKEAIHFAKENPLLWHKMSVAYWYLENFEEADRCNKRALALEDLPEARKMEDALKEKLDTGSLTNRFFGR